MEIDLKYANNGYSMERYTETTNSRTTEGADELEKQGLEGLIRALRDSADRLSGSYAAYLLGEAKSPVQSAPHRGACDFDKSVRLKATFAPLARQGLPSNPFRCNEEPNLETLAAAKHWKNSR